MFIGPAFSGAFGAHTPTLVNSLAENVGIFMGDRTNLGVI